VELANIAAGLQPLSKPLSNPRTPESEMWDEERIEMLLKLFCPINDVNKIKAKMEAESDFKILPR
jgi:hypothetical protein